MQRKGGGVEGGGEKGGVVMKAFLKKKNKTFLWAFTERRRKKWNNLQLRSFLFSAQHPIKPDTHMFYGCARGAFVCLLLFE